MRKIQRIGLTMKLWFRLPPALLPLLALSLTWGGPPVLGVAGVPESATVLWVYALDRPAVEVPRQFAREAVPVVQCESGFDPSAVSRTRDYGSFQINEIHRMAMRAAGLDFDGERDRVLWAAQLWQEQGWRPWTCGHLAVMASAP